MPLLWAHAEFVKLATASITKQPMELLEAVKLRYNFERPHAKIWHWRTNAPFLELHQDMDLLIEACEPFQLHFSLCEWRNTENRSSQPLGFGMHGVRLRHRQLQDVGKILFTLYYLERKEWENVDYCITVVPRLKGQPATQEQL